MHVLVSHTLLHCVMHRIVILSLDVLFVACVWVQKVLYSSVNPSDRCPTVAASTLPHVRALSSTSVLTSLKACSMIRNVAGRSRILGCVLVSMTYFDCLFFLHYGFVFIVLSHTHSVSEAAPRKHHHTGHSSFYDFFLHFYTCVFTLSHDPSGPEPNSCQCTNTL